MTFDEYQKNRIQRLNGVLKARKKVFIDINHIIEFTKLEKQNSSSVYAQEYQEIYDLLLLLVNKKVLECVFSDNILEEIIKQKDLDTRQLTCKVIDKISNKVILIPFLHICTWEFNNLYRYYRNEQPHQLLVFDFVPTILVQYIGDLMVDKRATDPAKISNYERFLNMNFSSLVELFVEVQSLSIPNRLAENYVPDKNQYSASIDKEIKRHVENIIIKDVLMRGMEIDFLKSMADKFTISKMIELCPCNYIYTALNVEMKRDGRALKPNDFYDMVNCSMAIPHCDYLFTEKAYTHRCNNILSLNKKFDVIIEGNPKLFLQQMKGLYFQS